MLTKLKNGLDGTQLKTIALALMVLDHIHYFFEFTGCIPTVFSMLGRLSAPLFLFCTVEGFAHTHDRRRYFIRIWGIGTAMAALEFFMIYAKAFRRGDGFYPLNAIFQDLMLLYNGQRGSGHKQLFYWFYPAHVYLLYGASCLLYNVLR